MTTVAQGWLAHLTVQGLTDIYQHQDVASVPLTGLPPVPIAAAWPAGNRNPMVKVFIEAGVASRG